MPARTHLILQSVAAAVLFSVALALVTVSATAQANDGQFCVRAFEDRNGNGIRDGEPVREPLLEEGISAELTDANGIVIGSALLIDSPTAAQGFICFQNLAPGQYTIIISSADYVPTTPDTMTVTLQAGQVPAVLEYGAQPFVGVVQIADLVDEVSPIDSLERVLWSLLGAIIAAIIMLLLGLIVFFVFVRRRIRRLQREAAAAPPDDYYRRPPTDTGTYYPPGG